MYIQENKKDNSNNSDNLTNLSNSVKKNKRKKKKKEVDDILFKLPYVNEPIMGTPKEAQDEIDKLVLKMQKDLESKQTDRDFDKIHLYMHGYFLNVVLKQFPYIKGYETVDIYQESLIAVRFKAVPNFDPTKGMSFLNFAKMCIRRHLITILNASKTRLKDQPINQSISLDSCSNGNNEDDEGEDFYEKIPNGNKSAISASELTSSKEAYLVTLENLKSYLSKFERIVLEEWLLCGSYKEIAENISKKSSKKCDPKSVDNALLRIRKKAETLKASMKEEEFPMFIL